MTSWLIRSIITISEIEKRNSAVVQKSCIALCYRPTEMLISIVYNVNQGCATMDTEWRHRCILSVLHIVETPMVECAIDWHYRHESSISDVRKRPVTFVLHR